MLYKLIVFNEFITPSVRNLTFFISEKDFLPNRCLKRLNKITPCKLKQLNLVNQTDINI